MRVDPALWIYPFYLPKAIFSDLWFDTSYKNRKGYNNIFTTELKFKIHESHNILYSLERRADDEIQKNGSDEKSLISGLTTGASIALRPVMIFVNSSYTY